MHEKQVVAPFMLPLTLMAGTEVVEKVRYLLQAGSYGRIRC